MKREYLALKTVAGMLFLFAAMGAALFLSAGTLRYIQGWAYLAAFFVPVAIITVYIYRRDKGLLRSRLAAGPVAEARPWQKAIQGMASLAFIAMYIVSALDWRHGWSGIPPLVSYLCNGGVVAGMWIVGRVFKANSYLSATIEVQRGQKVIDSGPYRVVRHPMYSGAALMLVCTPPALGSWWGVCAAMALVAVIALRALDEERYLAASLPGYADYRRKVRWRLLPGVW